MNIPPFFIAIVVFVFPTVYTQKGFTYQDAVIKVEDEYKVIPIHKEAAFIKDSLGHHILSKDSTGNIGELLSIQSGFYNLNDSIPITVDKWEKAPDALEDDDGHFLYFQ